MKIDQEEARRLYDDYVSSCVERGQVAISFEEWVARLKDAPVAGEVDPDDDFPF